MEEFLIDYLAPLAFTVSWSIFAFSKKAVVSLVALLLTSLALPLVFMDYFKLFWPCGLLLILVSTGLIVIFAYVVSLHPEELSQSKVTHWYWLTYFFTTVLIFMNYLLTPSPNKVYHSYWEVFVDSKLSFFLMVLLLFLVVSFIRIVYSKGGGFRKKF